MLHANLLGLLCADLTGHVLKRFGGGSPILGEEAELVTHFPPATRPAGTVVSLASAFQYVVTQRPAARWVRSALKAQPAELKSLWHHSVTRSAEALLLVCLHVAMATELFSEFFFLKKNTDLLSSPC